MLLYYLAAIFKGLHPRVDDDFVDKLNYHYTSAIIFAFAIIVSAKQYVGYPIQCWVPAQFTDAWEQYTENYCWVQNTYFVPMTDPIPPEYAVRNARQIGYYQWVPFVLAIEALMFYIPCILWRGMLSWHAGIDVQNLTQMACDARMLDLDSRHASVRTITGHVVDALEIQREVGGRDKDILTQTLFFCGRYCSSYITVLYFFIKLLYVVNCFGQILILNSFLGTYNLFYGFHVLHDLIRGREWQESGHFPRVTMCDFEVRVLGNVHHHTVQCVLMINMFNEKIFLFLWFWFFLVTAITIVSCAHWFLLSAIPSIRERFVRRYLRASEEVVTDHQSMKRFISFLRPDGIFCLRLISNHAGDIVTTDLIAALWHHFTHMSKRQTMLGVSAAAMKGDVTPKSGNPSHHVQGHKQSHQGHPPHSAGGGAAPSRRQSYNYFPF